MHGNFCISDAVLFSAISHLLYFLGIRPENLKFLNFKNKKSVEFSALMVLKAQEEVVMSIDLSVVTKQKRRIFL